MLDTSFASQAATSATILVVEDDASFRRYLRELLEGEGYRVRLASGGEEALRLYQQLHPDLLVTDIFMPDGDGIELINTIHITNRTLPIIALSGGSVTDTADLYLGFAVRLGANAVLHKPFAPSDLVKTVLALLQNDSAST